MKEEGLKRGLLRKGSLFALFLVCGLVTAHFLRYALIKVYAIDEGSTLAYALSILDGRVLYRDILCAIPPGTYYLQALFFWLFGYILWPGRVLVALLNLAAALTLFRFLLRRNGAAWAMAGLLLFGTIWAPYNHFLNKNIFAFLLILPVGLLLWRLPERRGDRDLYLLGAFIALTGLFKHNVALYAGAAAGAAIVLESRRERIEAGGPLILALINGARYLGGALMVLGPVFAAMAWHGNLLSMIRSLTDVSSYQTYAATLSTRFAWYRLPALGLSAVAVEAWYGYLLTLLPLFAGILGLVLFFISRSKDQKTRRALYLALLSFALWATLYPRMERSHVNLLYAVLPVVLAGILGALPGAVSTERMKRMISLGAAGFLLLMGTGGLLENLLTLDRYNAPVNVRGLECLQLRPEETDQMEKLNAWLAANIDQDESVQILDYNYLIYFLLRRPPALANLGASYLALQSPSSQRWMIEQFEREDQLPDVILLDGNPNDSGGALLREWILRHYRMEERLWIPEAGATGWYLALCRRKEVPASDG